MSRLRTRRASGNQGAMKLICLTPVRSDAWSLAATSRAVLKWADAQIVCENAEWADPATRAALPDDDRVRYVADDAIGWNEVDIRLRMLQMAREMGGTHFALVDADELLTGNLIPRIRDMAEALSPGQCLRLPWHHLWRGLDQYRTDASPFGKRAMTWALFRDDPRLTYRAQEDGYQIHARAPLYLDNIEWQDRSRGLMHMQHVVWRRVVAKQVMYRMVEHLRWNRGAGQINQRYGPATDEAGLTLSPVPAEWWAGNEDVRELVDTAAVPWQEAEISRLLAEHGRERFAGLDLQGY